METAHTIYLGNLRTEATHLRSGNKIITDAPTDNHGKGEYFSPTDLLATSLASCAFTIIGIATQTHGFSIDGATAKTTKIMADNPRRVAEIVIEFTFPPNNYSDKDKKIIEHILHNCPVSKSLHPDLKQTVKVTYL